MLTKAPQTAADAVLSAAKAAKPDVSFIVCAYNVAPYIAASVKSALEQVEASIEVIVVDDASTDGTRDILLGICAEDARVILVCRKENGGPSVSRNEAMRLATGRWIAILDGDDIIASDRSRALLDLAAMTSADVVADNFERFYEEGKATGLTMIPRADQPYSFVVDVGAFIGGNVTFQKAAVAFGAIKPMFRTKWVRANKLVFREHIAVGEDYHFCLATLMAGARFVVTSADFYKYRMRSGSQSWRLNESHIETLLQEHRALRLEERYRGNKGIIAASRAYEVALIRAGKFLAIVSSLKQRRLGAGLWASLTQPEVWSLLVRFGGEAAARRLRWIA